VVLHRATRRDSPGHTPQVWWEKLPISETLLIKGADQVLTCLPLFFRIILMEQADLLPSRITGKFFGAANI